MLKQDESYDKISDYPWVKFHFFFHTVSDPVSKIQKDLKSVFFTGDSYGGIFLCLSCLELVFCGSLTHHHGWMVSLLTVFLLLVDSSLLSPWIAGHGLLHIVLQDEDNIAQDFWDFSISHEKQIMNYK
jgi:hypothetical protein